jgi:ribonuclease Z
MTTIVTITGTGVPIITAGRAGPGVVVKHRDTILQFDAGRATALRLSEAGVETSNLTALFITHHHSDHLTGLCDVVFSRWVAMMADHIPLPIVAPIGPSTTYVEHMLDVWADDIAVRLEHTGRPDGPEPDVIGFDASTEPREVWSEGDVRVIAAAVRHEPVTPSVAYRIETPDGAVVISGDTRVCEEVESLAAGAQVLVHEAFRTKVLSPLFEARPQLERIADYHSDTHELGAMAQRIGVPMLMLTHLIPAPSAPEQVAGFESDLREGGFTGDVIVCADLDSVAIDSGEVSRPAG